MKYHGYLVAVYSNCNIIFCYCDGVETIPYSSVCEALDQCLNGSKIAEVLKQEAQEISCVVQSIVEEEYKQEIDVIVSEVDAASIFGKVTPEEMKEEQQKELILELVYTNRS